jgi:Ca2+-binding RTX toxin-like protein
LAAKLNAYSDLGEGNPAWLASSTANSGFDLYGEQAMYRLRIYTSAGFSADGIGSILPTDFSKFFQLRAKDDHGSDVVITSSGLDYNISGFGSVRVLGIADTGLFQSSYDISYVEDHDNQYDIILSGDLAAVARLYSIRMPSGEGRSPVYNPGGPGNDPGNNPPVRFTVASSDQTIEITNDFQDSSFVSYIEIDGPVAKDAVSGQPIGTLIGLAVHDSSINHTIYQYIDPTGKRFYASDDFVIEINIVTGDNRNNSNLTGSAGVDQIYGLGGNDRLFGFAGDDLLDGGLGRDRMSGGSGNDVYIVDGRKDLVFEFRNQGIDEIRTTLSSFTLPSNVENLTFTGMGRFTGSGNGLANRIEGGSSDDTLYGQGGDDELYGQAGRDILIGGAKQDWLYGGADADRFVFSSTSDIGLGARSDVIADFERGLDLIDLRYVDANTRSRRDQSFDEDFVTEFTGARGEIRITAYADGVIVSGDVNGDRLADFDLQVVGVTTLTASDFLL